MRAISLNCIINRARRSGVAFLSCVLLLIAPAYAAQPSGSGDSIHQDWVDRAGVGLDPRALDALSRIHGADRRLLALRAYLRAGDSLAAKWSWSQAELTRYPSTPEGKAAAQDLDAVMASFAKANAGYGLGVNRQPRSLELQLAHWNDNASVISVAAALAQSLDRRFPAASAPSSAQLRDALMQWAPSRAAALAAPGMSAHGQGRAFDFVITRNGRTIAGTDSASAHSLWDDAGWTEKLHAAVLASNTPFRGPLQSPYEPWHYAYTPR